MAKRGRRTSKRRESPQSELFRNPEAKAAPVPDPERSESDQDPEWLERVRAKLGAWFDRQGRQGLPWRIDRDPYRVLVAEVMLVQTTVAAVGPHFERFLARFPTVRALAEAEEAEVVKAWEGLGYYRRARQLHQAARRIVEEHGGQVPADPEVLVNLPGVGRYIAGAVLSIAFDRPAAILEANSERVLARWLAWPEELRKTASKNRLWEAAERLVPEQGAGRFNQALMDLGATVCLPKAPRCLACPVASECQARRLGLQEAIPKRVPRKSPLDVEELAALAVREDGRFLTVRRGPDGLWAGFWEFPTLHVAGADPVGRSVLGSASETAVWNRRLDPAEGFERLTGIALNLGASLLTIRYGVTKHRVTLTVVRATPIGDSTKPGPGLAEVAWLTLDELAERSRTVAARRIAAWAAGRSESRNVHPESKL